MCVCIDKQRSTNLFVAICNQHRPEKNFFFKTPVVAVAAAFSIFRHYEQNMYHYRALVIPFALSLSLAHYIFKQTKKRKTNKSEKKNLLILIIARIQHTHTHSVLSLIYR